ncbi:hypothetical protein M5K25_001728 [Dendrobium thyrsiflorum]|uniref:Uncharacterized protein n=1 Tax=Dendrobium thyrsiflorum TaxID=117978 RepID=A0ABD0VR57_DENTH
MQHISRLKHTGYYISFWYQSQMVEGSRRVAPGEERSLEALWIEHSGLVKHTEELATDFRRFTEEIHRNLRAIHTQLNRSLNPQEAVPTTTPAARRGFVKVAHEPVFPFIEVAKKLKKMLAKEQEDNLYEHIDEAKPRFKKRHLSHIKKQQQSLRIRSSSFTLLGGLSLWIIFLQSSRSSSLWITLLQSSGATPLLALYEYDHLQKNIVSIKDVSNLWVLSSSYPEFNLLKVEGNLG